MIKYLFIVINTLTVFLYGLFGGDGEITVTGKIPKNINPGQEVAIEILVTKGSMSGFAKLQLDLPEGFSVKEIDSKGANFTFTDGLAKWVWSSLPADNELIIKAFLVASSSANGVKTIGGKYSYVENNGKQVVEMASAEVTVGVSESTANNQATTNSTQTTNTTTTQSTTTPTTETTSNTNAEPSVNITVVRSIVKNLDNEYTVNLKIKKGATKGFARYSDDLPQNFNAKSTKTDGSSFSVADGKIKFVWVTVPDKEEMEIAYTIIGTSTTPLVLNGEYSFLEQNQSKKYKLQPELITYSNTQTTAISTPNIESTATSTTATETKTDVVVNTPTINTSETTNTTQTTNNNTITETITKTEGNVNYMVQIGAFTNAGVSVSILSQKFKVTETIKSEMQGGFSKFMIGNYAEYKAARDRREDAKNNNRIKSAFVVAYNLGKRITVQEALMVTNQKWFK